jgi:hypothetical protein
MLSGFFAGTASGIFLFLLAGFVKIGREENLKYESINMTRLNDIHNILFNKKFPDNDNGIVFLSNAVWYLVCSKKAAIPKGSSLAKRSICSGEEGAEPAISGEFEKIEPMV